ncbi:hypothetical protein [Nocardia sp. NPDC024068]|uniref:hypothetical protein n=1 Tax=Nocardia sp. NPDC024068 TaxID=3157197 RepID=UPI0033E66A82
MSTGTPQSWTDDPEEAAAVEAMYRVVAEMARSLHAFTGARYADPSGGHRVGPVARIER